MLGDQEGCTQCIDHPGRTPGLPPVLEGEGEDDLIAVESGDHQDLGLSVLDHVHAVVVERDDRADFDFVVLGIPEEDVIGVDDGGRVEPTGNQDPVATRDWILDFSAGRIGHVVQGKVQLSAPLFLVPVVDVDL